MPDWKQEIARRLAPLHLAPTREASVAEELEQHAEDHYRELIAGGASSESARSAALAGLDRHELLRELRQVDLANRPEPVPAVSPERSLFSGIGQDLRYSLRVLLKNPGFSAIAVLTIALGIAANTSIFSVINSLFLHPPGVVDPDRLLVIQTDYTKLNMKNIGVSLTDYADVRDSKKVFSTAAAMQAASFNYSAGSLPQRLQGTRVTWQWFGAFGAKALLGRTFTEAEDLPGAEHEVVLSYATWQRLFGADPAIVDKSIVLNDESYRVVGVMPRDFNWPAQGEIWVPLGVAPKAFGPNNRFNESYQAVARVAPGVTREQAQSYMSIITEHVTGAGDQSGQYAKASLWSMHAQTFVEAIYGNLRTPLMILFGSVAFVLLICCANVAGLLLAKASGRARELAIRTALGARRGHLARQVGIESLILAASGTAVGILLAVLAVRNAAAIAPAGSIDGVTLSIDRTVLLFSIGAGLVSALLFGLAPAFTIASAKTFELLKEGGRSAMAGKGRQRIRAALVIGEVGLALVLLAGSGLFLKSLIRIQQVNPGFDSRGVMTAAVSLNTKAYKTDEKKEMFYTSLAHTLSAQPGVQSAAVVYGLSFSPFLGGSSFQIEGRPSGPGDPGPHSDISAVTPDFFQTLRIPLLAGRNFSDEDRLKTERVVIIDENLAKQYWPGQNPVGAHIGYPKQMATVIGVVGHVKRSSLTDDNGKGLRYYPMSQLSDSVADIVVRTSGDPVAVGSRIREAVQAVDPSQAATYDLQTLDARVAASLGPRRFAVTMLLAFAAIALFMAALGLYGVISYSVAQRTQEIGVRMALGARLSQVLWMVLSQSMRMVLAGVAIGLVISLILARMLRSELIQVSTFDPLTFAGMCAVLIVVTLAATYLPARRAAKVDPMVALRYE